MHVLTFCAALKKGDWCLNSGRIPDARLPFDIPFKMRRIHLAALRNSEEYDTEVLHVSIDSFYTFVREVLRIDQRGQALFLFTPIPLGGVAQCSSYLDSLAFFLSLTGFLLICFSVIHPQPQLFSFSAISITSFLLKPLSNYLNTRAKKMPSIL